MYYKKESRFRECPFCGKLPKIYKHPKTKLYFLECCYIRCFGYFRSEQKLINIWNDRSYIREVLNDKTRFKKYL